MTVLRGFIAGANAQYRAAGLGQYQMHVDASGKVSAPGAPAPRFKPVPGTGSAAPDQASAGASGATTTSAPTAGAAPAAGPARSGAAPKLTALKPTTDGFAMRWDPVAGAKRYGIYVDGTLVGHVPKPAFDGKLTAGSGGVVQVDAVRADGTRTALTPAVRLDRDASGKLVASDPNAAAAASPDAATAPAAAAS